MSFNRYFQEELLYLRDMGREFANAYPKLAPFLAGKGNDPDVERLLEGFAFIAGRIRQKLDDELPELTHTLLSLLSPNFLRPLPATSILKFTPMVGTVTEKKTVEVGTEIDSVPVEGTSCRFRTSYPVDLYPLQLDRVELENIGAGAKLKLRLKLHSGMSLDKVKLDTLRLHLNGELPICQLLYRAFLEHLQKITLQPAGQGNLAQTLVLPPQAIKPVGFNDDEALFPYPKNAFSGYRLLQEYFVLPQKFMFLDLTEMGQLVRLPQSEEYEVVFDFSRPFDRHVRLTNDSIQLYCTPIVNLFKKDAVPIRLKHEKTEYRVMPAGGDANHFEIFSVDAVSGWAKRISEKRIYQPFVSLGHGIEADNGAVNFYKTRIHPSVLGRSVDTYLSFVTATEKNGLPPEETISIDLSCTNRNLPNKLRIGDVHVPTGNSPEYANFRSLLATTKSIPPPLGSGLQWLLISNMSLNYLSLANVEALRTILSTYNFQALYDRGAARANELRMEGLNDISTEPVTLLMNGSPIRGTRAILEMKSSNFSNEGDMYLLAAVLKEFFSHYASINSFIQFVVRDIERNEEYRWKPRVGTQHQI